MRDWAAGFGKWESPRGGAVRVSVVGFDRLVEGSPWGRDRGGSGQPLPVHVPGHVPRSCEEGCPEVSRLCGL